MVGLRIVGTDVKRIDAPAKATGKARFASERGLGAPGMLYGKVLFSPHAHARIAGIDVSKALGLRGVKAVATGADVPDHRNGILIDDRHVLCREVARFVGDPIACVAAVSAETAEEAVGLIEVDYEILPAVFDVEWAMSLSGRRSAGAERALPPQDTHGGCG
jgi:CO/xanthine dehydrogenase Mo-binding subunit